MQRGPAQVQGLRKPDLAGDLESLAGLTGDSGRVRSPFGRFGTTPSLPPFRCKVRPPAQLTTLECVPDAGFIAAQFKRRGFWRYCRKPRTELILLEMSGAGGGD